MKIIADTRETKPLEFSIGGVLTEVTRRKLEVGDYQAEYIDGSLSRTVFERKSLGDLYNTMTNGYKRFKKEMERAVEIGVRLILIVECSYSEVASGYEHSDFEGKSMVKKLGTLWFKYNLPTIFTNGRDDMAGFIVGYFTSEGYDNIRKRKGERHAKNDCVEG